MPAADRRHANPKVAVVLPGGGARGGYEAGALSVLLPALERRGERITICCGTSVGAINAALLGSLAGLPGHQAAAQLLDTWRGMRKADVIAPIFGPALLAKRQPLLSRLLSGSARSRGELLSFMLYDEDFVAELIRLGRRDARRWLARHPRFWCADGAHDLGMAAAAGVAADDRALEEFRERRRR